MAEIACTTKRWGNSLGVIIPKSLVAEENIVENEKVFLDIKRKPQAREFFGLLVDWAKPTDRIKQEMKKGW